MVGVDEFKSTQQAKLCKEKAEKRLEKSGKLIMHVIVLTVISILMLVLADKTNNVIVKVLYGICVVANIAFFTYAEWWFYILQFIILPFRKLASLGILGYIIAFIFLFPFTWVYGIMAILFAPIAYLPYVKYLCKITVKCASDIV